MIDGKETRLGNPAFCGLGNVTPLPGSSLIVFTHADQTAAIAIAQTLRPDAVDVMNALRGLGLDLRILSGDRNEVVAPVARSLGITYWQGGLAPAEKIVFIDSLKTAGRRVLVVGDGLNDAPALASAHVSLSPISAAGLTQAQADAVFLGDRLQPVYDAIMIARRARRLMKENLWFAALYNVVAVPIAIAGMVTPLIAALAMSGSSVSVTLNALRARMRP
jgi:Cu2+-exporting ATPase